MSFRLSFHQALLGPTGTHWLDDRSDLSCKGSTRQHSVDDTLMSCKQQVGGSSPPPAPIGARPIDPSPVDGPPSSHSGGNRGGWTIQPALRAGHSRAIREDHVAASLTRRVERLAASSTCRHPSRAPEGQSRSLGFCCQPTPPGQVPDAAVSLDAKDRSGAARGSRASATTRRSGRRRG
jgi:hypothetical protein